MICRVAGPTAWQEGCGSALTLLEDASVISKLMETITKYAEQADMAEEKVGKLEAGLMTTQQQLAVLTMQGPPSQHPVQWGPPPLPAQAAYFMT